MAHADRHGDRRQRGDAVEDAALAFLERHGLHLLARNHAVRGALGVGCALLDAQGAPILAVSVTAIIDRMPAQRQREIAGWIKNELARLSMQA